VMWIEVRPWVRRNRLRLLQHAIIPCISWSFRNINTAYPHNIVIWFLHSRSVVGLLLMMVLVSLSLALPVCDGSLRRIISYAACLAAGKTLIRFLALNFWVVIEQVIRDWLQCSVEETKLTEVTSAPVNSY